MIDLIPVLKTDLILRSLMAVHYSQPRGFVGRSLCYLVACKGELFGAIVGGSATLHLAGRDEFFKLDKADKSARIQEIINNIFYHVEPFGGRYPLRNFTVRVLSEFRRRSAIDWAAKYGSEVIGFETLVELPRTGETYARDGWTEVGITKGLTCKRVGADVVKGTDNWGGGRIWDTENLRPKRVFCRGI